MTRLDTLLHERLHTGATLSAELARAGMTPADLAARLGCHVLQVRRWLAGRVEPRREQLRRIIEALG